MVREAFTVIDEAGLHARPASLLCKSASAYKGDVNIVFKDKTYTLKSIMILMSLGIAQNAEFIIEVNGENESSKMDELKGILVENKIV